MYWKGLEPSELLEYDSHLVAFTQELPFQEGWPLSRITEEEEGSTELVEYNHTAESSPDHQTWLPFTMWMTTSRVLSTTPNYSQMYLPTSVQRMPLMTRMRSTEGSDG
jgi:hypothetical protein